MIASEMLRIKAQSILCTLHVPESRIALSSPTDVFQLRNSLKPSAIQDHALRRSSSQIQPRTIRRYLQLVKLQSIANMQVNSVAPTQSSSQNTRHIPTTCKETLDSRLPIPKFSIARPVVSFQKTKIQKKCNCISTMSLYTGKMAK